MAMLLLRKGQWGFLVKGMEAGAGAGYCTSVIRPRHRPIRDPGATVPGPTRAHPNANPDLVTDRFAHIRNDRNGAEIFIIGNSFHPCKTPDKIIQCLKGLVPSANLEADKIIQLLEKVRPKNFAIELCERRVRWLRGEEEEPDTTTMKSFYYFFNRMKFVQALLRNTFLQLDFATETLLKKSMTEAKRLGATVTPLDIDMKVTTQMWAKALLDEDFVSLSERLDSIPQKFPEFNKLHKSIEELNRKAFVPGEFPKIFVDAYEIALPEFYKCVMRDRNEHMVRRLRELEGKTVVLLGAAHLDAIVDLWKS